MKVMNFESLVLSCGIACGDAHLKLAVVSEGRDEETASNLAEGKSKIKYPNWKQHKAREKYGFLEKNADIQTR